eukprot:scaffold4947_cov269-Prasinococcus_capsulatus_cf.AAC.3
MLLGTSHVLDISARNLAVLIARMKQRGRSDDDIHAAVLLRGLLELCVFPTVRRRPAALARGLSSADAAWWWRAGRGASRWPR